VAEDGKYQSTSPEASKVAVSFDDSDFGAGPSGGDSSGDSRGTTSDDKYVRLGEHRQLALGLDYFTVYYYCVGPSFLDFVGGDNGTLETAWTNIPG
jgi:hypothetical protein